MPETLTIEIARPHAVSDLDAVRQEAGDKAYREAVFDLIHQGAISSGYGADLLGVNRVDLLAQLQRRGIPTADYLRDALYEEVQQTLQDLSGNPDHPG